MRYLHLMMLLPLLGRLMLADTAPGGGGGDPAGGGQPDQGGGGGFAPITSQADLDRIITERLARDRQSRPAAPPDLDELRRKAALADQLEAASRTDLERAAAEARTTGQQEGRRALLPSLIAAEIRAAAGGRLTAEQVSALTAPLSSDFFLGADGQLDAARVTGWVSGIPGLGSPAGQQDQGGQQGGQQGQQGQQGGGTTWPEFGQGSRQTPPANDREAGLAEARRRWPDKYAPQDTARR
jgi:hypothetical protein